MAVRSGTLSPRSRFLTCLFAVARVSLSVVQGAISHSDDDVYFPLQLVADSERLSTMNTIVREPTAVWMSELNADVHCLLFSA